MTRRYFKGPPEERFIQRVLVSPGCWIWDGALNDKGYGRFAVAGKHILAHRFAYELWEGPILEGEEVLHLCGNHACVRPEHLRVLPKRERAAVSVRIKGSVGGRRLVNRTPDEQRAYDRERMKARRLRELGEVSPRT